VRNIRAEAAQHASPRWSSIELSLKRDPPPGVDQRYEIRSFRNRTRERPTKLR